MHFQFIMANDQRAPYDYFMFVCGPIRLLDWAKDTSKALARIIQLIDLCIAQTGVLA